MAPFGDEWSGVNLKDSQDGLFNADKAKTEFNKAKEALQAQKVFNSQFTFRYAS